MKHLEIDIAKIAQLGEQNRDKNFDFRVFLKGQDFKKVDRIVHRFNKEITSKIDCQKCGNCCKSLRPCVTESEIERLSGIDNITSADFVSRFVEKENYDNIAYLKGLPCKYLKDKICSIYRDRPEDCKSFPHTDKTGFVYRTLEMIENYGICPIAYNLVERLKPELGFK